MYFTGFKYLEARSRSRQVQRRSYGAALELRAASLHSLCYCRAILSGTTPHAPHRRGRAFLTTHNNGEIAKSCRLEYAMEKKKTPSAKAASPSPATGADLYWAMFCSSRQAIKEAATDEGVTCVEEGGAREGGGGEDGSTRRQSLEERLEGYARRASHSQQAQVAPHLSGDKVLAGLKRAREEAGICSAQEAQDEAAHREDESLALVAEAFVDELDVLRSDEHFGGSARDIEAMADMMR